MLYFKYDIIKLVMLNKYVYFLKNFMGLHVVPSTYLLKYVHAEK